MDVTVIVIGAKGMFGRDIVDTFLAPPFKFNVLAWDIDEIDITKSGEVAKKIEEVGANLPLKYVINCAAYTDVDGAEVERELSYEINAIGAKNVASATAMIGARTIYISTDYIFRGDRSDPLREDDNHNPVNYYGSTKLSGEEFTNSMDPEALIVRTQWLFGPHGRNFVETMLALQKRGEPIKVVDDQIGTPTYTLHLADAIGQMMQGSHSGAYHVSNSGSTSWFGFAKAIFELAELEVELIPISTEEYIKSANKIVAERPRNSVFNMEKISCDAGLTMKSWREGLGEYLKRRGAPR